MSFITDCLVTFDTHNHTDLVSQNNDLVGQYNGIPSHYNGFAKIMTQQLKVKFTSCCLQRLYRSFQFQKYIYFPNQSLLFDTGSNI